MSRLNCEWRDVSCWPLKKTDEVEKTTGWREKSYSWDAYVYDWIKWLGRESDHKPLYNVDITSGAIILSLYVSNFQFILLTFLFRAQCMYRKFQLQELWSSGLAWWCQKSHRTSHTHTHTSYFLSTSLKTFFFSPLAVHRRHFSCVPVTNNHTCIQSRHTVCKF
jgi:hypothetical protein